MNGASVLSGAVSAQAQSTKDEKAPDKQSNPAQSAKQPDTAKPQPGNAAKAPMNKAGSGPHARPTKSEFAVLESLSKRRKELDRQRRELTLRENLLKAAENRVDKRISELKQIEVRLNRILKKSEEINGEKFTRLVKMYSSMKPKQAARIFNRLKLDVLVGLVQRMKPKKMSSILAVMDTGQAERLTLELADQNKKEGNLSEELPKINGRDEG